MKKLSQSRKLKRSAATGIATLLLSTLVAGLQAQINWQPMQQVEVPPVTEEVLAMRPRLASNGRGDLVAVYEARPNGLNPVTPQAGIRAVRSSSNGTTWSQSITLPTTGGDARPDIATDAVGNWLVATQIQSGPATLLPAYRSTNDGANWINLGFINTSAGANLTSNSNVAIATNRNGAWAAAWYAYDNALSTSTIVIARSDNNGNGWQVSSQLNGATPTAAPAIAGHPTGGFVVAYEKEVNQVDDSELAFAKLSIDGSLTTSGLVNTDADIDFESEYAPSVTVSDAGEWVVTWARYDAPDWYVAAATAADGITWADPAILSNDSLNFVSATLADPSSAAGQTGRLVSVRSSQDSGPPVERELYYDVQPSLLLEDGAPSRVDFADTQAEQFVRPHVIEAAGGRWVAMWQRRDGAAPLPPPSGAIPWFTHGEEQGVAANDVATTTDLSITKTAWPTPVASNGTLGYVITVRNVGTSFSANLVSVTDVLPPNIALSHVLTSQGTWAQGSVNGAPVVVANLGSVAPGARATIAIAVRPTAPTGSIVNTATVDFLGLDSDLANNSASVTVAIGGSGPVDPDEPDNPDNPNNPGNPGNPGNPQNPATALQFTTSNLKISGKQPKPGKPAKPYKVKLKAVLTNTTSAPTAPGTLNIYISTDAALDGADVMVGTEAIKSVKPGKPLKAGLSLKVDGNPTGKYLLLAVPGQTPVAAPLF